MEPTDTSKSDYFHRVVDCQWACPAHTDVPEYIRLIAQGEFTAAYMVNRESAIGPVNPPAGAAESRKSRWPSAA
jgi:formate dehydrogenase (NADP+) beta subunit